MDFEELVSIKVYRSAHVLLRYMPALGIQMQDFATKAIYDKFKEDYPTLFEQVMARYEPEIEAHFDMLHEKAEEQLELDGVSKKGDRW